MTPEPKHQIQKNKPNTNAITPFSIRCHQGIYSSQIHSNPTIKASMHLLKTA